MTDRCHCARRLAISSVSYSFRPLQRALKGGQLELQPQVGWLDGTHSLQFSSGSNQQTYVGSAFENWFDDYFNGASWLTENGGSTYSFSLVHGFRQADGATPDRNQVTGSFAGVHDRRVGSQILSFEGEMALLNGDIGNGGAGQTDALDYSVLAQVSGRSESSPLTYSFRFDQTGGGVPAERWCRLLRPPHVRPAGRIQAGERAGTARSPATVHGRLHACQQHRHPRLRA